MKNTKEIHKSDLWRVLNKLLNEKLPEVSYLSEKRIMDAAIMITDSLIERIYEKNEDILKDKDYGNGE